MPSNAVHWFTLVCGCCKWDTLPVWLVVLAFVVKAIGWKREDCDAGEIVLAFPLDAALFGLYARHVGTLRFAFSLLNLGCLAMLMG